MDGCGCSSVGGRDNGGIYAAYIPANLLEVDFTPVVG